MHLPQSSTQFGQQACETKDHWSFYQNLEFLQRNRDPACIFVPRKLLKTIVDVMRAKTVGIVLDIRTLPSPQPLLKIGTPSLRL